MVDNPTSPAAPLPSRRFGLRLAIWYATSAFGLVLAATAFLYWTMARSLEREEAEFLSDKLYTLGVVLATDYAEIEKEVEVEWAGGPDARLFVRLIDETGTTIAETRERQLTTIRNVADVDRLMDGLRKAGLPE